MKFKQIILLSIFMILTAGFVNSAETNGVYYWNFPTMTSQWTPNAISNAGGFETYTGWYAIYNIDGDSSPSSLYTNSDSNSYGSIQTGFTFSPSSGSQTFSIYLNTTGAFGGMFLSGSTGTSDYMRDNGVFLSLRDYGGTDLDLVFLEPRTLNTADHIVMTKTGTTYKLYKNGVLQDTQQHSGTFTFNWFGRGWNGPQYWYNGYIDEMKYYNAQLTQTQITNLYNCGSVDISQCGYENFTITAKSYWNNSTINNFSAKIDGNIYNTSSGIITTDILDNSTSLHNITVFSNGRFNETNETYNVSNHLILTLKQSEISFNCLEKISGNILTCDNETIYPDAGEYNFTVGVTGYYTNITKEVNVSALDNKTETFTGFYTTNLTFNPVFINGPGAGTCNYTIEGITYPSYNEVVNANSTGLINGSYNVTVDCDGYAYDDAVIVINETEQTLNFSLYTSNSIDISIFDETTGNLITGINITVTKTLGAVQEQNITGDGTIGYKYLTAGNYSFTFEGENYPQRTHTVEIGERTYQTLNVYLLANSTDAVILTFQEYNSNAVIEGVTLQISSVINGTNTLIAVLNSDITGKVQFYFDTTSKYCFVASKTDYESKSFCLNPIIFNSYTISLETSVELSTGDAFEEVLIEYTPKKYRNNENNTITFTFANPEGSLNLYGFNATYNGSTVSASGTNAYGEVLTTDLEITGAQYGDQVTVYYYYKKTGDTTFKTQKLIYDILGYDSTTDSIQDNPPGDYGLGLFTSTLIAVILILLVSGLASFFGGPVAGGSMALLMFTWLMYIEFLNFWAGVISVILLFVVVAWRSNQ